MAARRKARAAAAPIADAEIVAEVVIPRVEAPPQVVHVAELAPAGDLVEKAAPPPHPLALVAAQLPPELRAELARWAPVARGAIGLLEALRSAGAVAPRRRR